MTENRLQVFRGAFVGWREHPVVEMTENAFLFHASNSLVSIQGDISPTMNELFERGVPLPPPAQLPVRDWNRGMSYLLVREIETLRGHLRRGRNQVATRALIEDALRLQAAWDAYERIVRT